MTRTDASTLARKILDHVGGPDNVAGVTHCVTRLRIQLRDDARADADTIEKYPGVLAVVRAGGQFQVVIGTTVPDVYAEFAPLVGAGSTNDRSTPASTAEKSGGRRTPRSILNSAMELISALLSPILWTLAGAGLLKAFLSAAVQFDWLVNTDSTYVILNAAGDSLFYFLPIILAVTSARRFGANEFTSMAIGGALVYPAIVAFTASDAPVSFLGIPVITFNYTSSLIPIIVAVWLQSHLERELERRLPRVIGNFGVPLVVLVIMVPLVLLTIGPAATTVSNALSSGIASIFTTVPWLAGAVMGGLWQFLVLFGLHWAFIPIVTTEVASTGSSLIGGVLIAPVLAQAAAALAVFLRTRSATRRGVAGPAAFSGFLAGVTEPAIYGVNLPLRRPFAFGLLGGAVGGGIIAYGGTAVTTLALPSLLSIPGFTTIGSVGLLAVGLIAAVLVAFALTFFFVDRERADAAPGDAASADTDDGNRADTDDGNRGDVQIGAPVSGEVLALDRLPDKVFASGSLGDGIAVRPTSGHVVSPVAGSVVVASASGHAYGITTDDGIELLVHVGLDTVRMEGRGFTPRVQRGDRVEAGDPLVDADLHEISEAGYDPSVIVVVTNSKSVGEVHPLSSPTVVATEPLLIVSLIRRVSEASA